MLTSDGGRRPGRCRRSSNTNSFIKRVHPRDVNSALCPVVWLFLEQPKVSAEDSEIYDSFMQDIKKSAINEVVHANLFGIVSEFISSMTPRIKRIQCLSELTYFYSLLR